MDKIEITQKVDEEIGIDRLFIQLGFKEVSRQGDKIYSVCPFHSGADNPTAFCFTVSKGFGYCFTKCHKSYDIFNVIMTAKDYDFRDAVDYLSEIADVNIQHKNRTFKNRDNLDFLSQVKRVRRKRKQNIKIETFDENMLNEFIPGLHTVYRQKGFDSETRDYFDLRFATDGYFKDRVIIPVDNIDGSILTISGRSILPDEDIEIENIRKYLLYKDIDKSQTLYNISRAEPYIDLLKEVIVVEGFNSVFRFHQWEIDNVVAVMGSTITDRQVEILLKTGAKIIVCGDRDKAGKRLNETVIEKCKLYADVSYIDMYEIDVPESSSPADITKEQWEYLYNNRKAVN